MELNNVFEKRLDDLLYSIDSDSKEIIYNDIPTIMICEESEEMLEYLYQRAAIGMANRVYRNGEIENVHVHNITDAQMKKINKDVCNKCYELIVDNATSDIYVSALVIQCYLYSKYHGGLKWDAPSLIPRLFNDSVKLFLYENDSSEHRYGMELLVKNKNPKGTDTTDMIVVFFTDKEFYNEVSVNEVCKNSPFTNGAIYTLEDFINILDTNYILVSHSMEYEEDLLD